MENEMTQGVIFSSKIKIPNHPVLFFNNISVNQTPYQKHPRYDSR